MNRTQAFRGAATCLLEAELHPELLALRSLESADLNTLDGTDAALVAYRTLHERIRARRLEADVAREDAERLSASFEIRCLTRVRLAMLDRCEKAINIVGKNLLNSGEVAA